MAGKPVHKQETQREVKGQTPADFMLAITGGTLESTNESTRGAFELTVSAMATLTKLSRITGLSWSMISITGLSSSCKSGKHPP